MATKKTTTPSKLDVAIEYLKKIANTTYVGSPDSEVVKRLRSFARQGLEAVDNTAEEK